jgi:D-xylose 1-dehydrogenase (NADP+, D-xylono-1,5-lactone-forming)
MRLGLLSTARINELIVAGARQAQGVEVVAVGSRERARAQEQAQALGIPRVHDSYEALIADPEIDAVYISLPNSLHVEWSMRALQAGRHVLCEKPLSRHPDDVTRVFDLAEVRGLIIAEAFMWRHHPQARRLVELAGQIGELRLVRASFSFLLERPGDVRLQSALEGGALMDVGCYCVSAARLVAGEPVSVSARQVLGGDGVDVRLIGLLGFAGEVLASIDCGLDLAARDELELAGTQGVLWLDDPWHARDPGIELRRPDGSVEHITVERVSPYACELEDLAAAIAGERPPRWGRADALGQARALAALHASAESHEVIEVRR